MMLYSENDADQPDFGQYTFSTDFNINFAGVLRILRDYAYKKIKNVMERFLLRTIIFHR